MSTHASGHWDEVASDPKVNHQLGNLTEAQSPEKQYVKEITDNKGDVRVMKEEKVGKIVDKVPAVELETAEEADKLEGLHTQPQSPDKEFVKVVIDTGNETDDNDEVYNN